MGAKAPFFMNKLLLIIFFISINLHAAVINGLNEEYLFVSKDAGDYLRVINSQIDKIETDLYNYILEVSSSEISLTGNQVLSDLYIENSEIYNLLVDNNNISIGSFHFVDTRDSNVSLRNIKNGSLNIWESLQTKWANSDDSNHIV